MKILQNSEIPIYKQISSQFREMILNGEMVQGDYLPSIRALAQDLKISVITTLKAYDELAAEGLITAAKGKGYYVNAQDMEMLREQHLRKLEANLTAAIECARVAGVGKDDVISMLDALWEVDI